MSPAHIIQLADGLTEQAERQLQQLPYEQQSADVRHALIKLAAARRGLADARAKAVKT